MPSQQLIVLFNGTSSSPKDRINVRRAYELMAAQDTGGSQKMPYLQGVGATAAGPACLSQKKARSGARLRANHDQQRHHLKLQTNPRIQPATICPPTPNP